MKTKKILRAALSLILVFFMMAGYVVMPVEAEESTYNYVALGASNINGYGMQGYRQEDGTNVYGYKQMVEKAYPAIFAGKLKAETGKEVKLTQLGISSFRAEEIHVMLDNDYMGDEYTDWRFHDGGQEWFKAAAAADGSYTGTALEHLRSEFQKAVKEADALTMDIGMNNFGVYVSQRVFDFLQGAELSFDPELDPELKEKHIAELEAMRDEINALVGFDLFEGDDALVDFLVETIQYAYVGFAENFDASLSHIYEMNKDVNVVVVGMYNTMADIMLEYAPGVILPAGDMIDIILKYANNHMEKESEYANRYTYVDSSDRHNFYHQLTEDGKTYATLSDECHRVMYEYSYDIAEGVMEDTPILSMVGTVEELADFIANVFVKIFTKALNNPYLDKEALGSMDTAAFEAAVTDCVTDAVTNGYVSGDYDYEPDLTFLDEEPNATIGFFWCRFFFEDWFYIHPDEEGHQDAADQIMNAYENAYLGEESDEPDTPDVPDVPDIPDVPDTPDLPDEPKVEFSDVAEDSWYYDAVYWAVENGITTGTSETTFSPERICTRAEAVTFLYRAAGEPEVKATNNPFTDVAESAYYYDAVLWAVENGITTGTSETTFSPDRKCMRSEIVTFIWRMEEKPEAENAENPFVDVAEDAWYYDAVLWAVEEEITTGTSETTFSPARECKRCEIVTFLYREFAEEK